MTDDRKFIVAIFADRGDDTPRLVFADWLDEQAMERGDPIPTTFAAYLRLGWAWSLESEENCIRDLVCLDYRVPPEDVTVSVPSVVGFSADRSWTTVECSCSSRPEFALARLRCEKLRTADESVKFVWHGRCEKCNRIHMALEAK